MVDRMLNEGVVGGGGNAVIIYYYLVLKYVLFNFRILYFSVSVVCHGVCMLSATSQWRGVSCVSWCLYAFSHQPVKGCQLCIMVCVCMLSATSQWRGVSCVSWCVSVWFQPPPSEGGVSLVSRVLPWRTHCSHTGMAGLQHILSDWLQSHLRVHLSAPPLTWQPVTAAVGSHLSTIKEQNHFHGSVYIVT